jgi:hypothetical protein
MVFNIPHRQYRLVYMGQTFIAELAVLLLNSWEIANNVRAQSDLMVKKSCLILVRTMWTLLSSQLR